MELDSPAPPASGLKTALDVVIAPKDAFVQLRSAPTWGWALLIAALLLIAGYFLQRPAQLHAAVGTTQHMMATNSIFSNMTDAQKQKAIDQAGHPSPIQTVLGLIFTPVTLLVAVLCNSVVLLVGNALARGKADFLRLWAGSMNVAIPTFGINYVVVGVMCLVLGADHFQTGADIIRLAPNVAMLAPGVTGFLGGFLVGINVFTLWGFALNVAMMRVMAGVNGAAAWIAPLVVLLGGAALVASGIAFSGG